MATKLEDFFANNPTCGFDPRPTYSREGDYLTYFKDNVDYVAQRVDSVLTLYRDADQGRLVGCKIKGIQTIMATLGDFGVAVDGDGFNMSVLFLGAIGQSGDARTMATYREVAGFTRDIRVQGVDLTPVA